LQILFILYLYGYLIVCWSIINRDEILIIQESTPQKNTLIKLSI
jgi:hypothetical protein